MCKFTVKERDQGRPCFIVEEENRIDLEIRAPADLSHAHEVAAFLNRHIKEVTVDRRLEEFLMTDKLGS